ncbi:uncharacterized protein [Antedon mediterranea]|uniref:uncharacterized protein n=1 Tax=Antedon mediterranea TaxID=105859 RepID=UPI003AF9B03C
MAVIVALYFSLLYFQSLLNFVCGATCINQGDSIYCPPASDSSLEYCCGDYNLEQCCSYAGLSSSTQDGLSNGAIAGIVIGCIVACLLLGMLAYFLRRLKMKLDERIMERKHSAQKSSNRNSIRRDAPVVRGSFKRNSMRTSTRRRDDQEPLNTRESTVFTTADAGLSNPGFDDGYRKPLGRTGPMQNGQPVYQNGHHQNGHLQNGHQQNGHHQNGHHPNGHQSQFSKDDMEIIGLEDSPKMYDKRKHWQDVNDPQEILQLEESPKMNEKWRHDNMQSTAPQQQLNRHSADAAMLRYHQIQEQHKIQRNMQLNAQYSQQPQYAKPTAQYGDMQHQQYSQQPVGMAQKTNGDTVQYQQQFIQQQPNQQQLGQQQLSQQQPSQQQLSQQQQQLSQQQLSQQQQTGIPLVQEDTLDGQSEQPAAAKPRKKKTPRRNLPKRIRDSDDSKWSMGYTRETVIQLKRNPSSKCNSPTASKDFDPDNPPGILKYRDSEMSDYDSILGDSDLTFDDQSFDNSRPQSGFFDKLTRRSPSPKQTAAVAPFSRQYGVDNHQPAPMDQFLTLDPSHLKAHIASYSPSQLSPSQLSPAGREGRYSYFSPNEDFDNSFAKSYPEFVQNKANQPKDVLPNLHINQNGGGGKTTSSHNGMTSPKEYVDYNRAGEELRCTSL